MTQEEIDFNKRCAVFMGWKNMGMVNLELWVSGKYPSGIMTSELKFHSDWNLIMEVVEAIDKLENVRIKILQNSCYIFIIDKDKLIALTKQSKREAVVSAINQFLIWYDQK